MNLGDENAPSLASASSSSSSSSEISDDGIPPGYRPPPYVSLRRGARTPAVSRGDDLARKIEAAPRSTVFPLSKFKIRVGLKMM